MQPKQAAEISHRSLRDCAQAKYSTCCACWRVATPCMAQSPNMPIMLAMYLRCREGTTTRRRVFHTSPSAGISPAQQWETSFASHLHASLAAAFKTAATDDGICSCALGMVGAWLHEATQ